MENAANKRKIYFIEKQFQARFIMKFCILVVLGGLLTIALLYSLTGRATTVSIVNSRVVVRSTADFLLPMLVQTVAIAVALTGLATIAVTLFVSHRIAGPLFRFKRVLEGLGEGDFSRGFKLRTHDQLQNVAEAMNEMIKSNRVQLGAIKDIAGVFKRNIERLDDGDIVSAKISLLYELRRAAKELYSVADRYRT